MHQINAYVFYLIGARLQTILSDLGQPIKFYVSNLRFVIDLLDGLLEGTLRFRLDESSAAARALRTILAEISGLLETDGDAILNEYWAARLDIGARTFDGALQLELGRAPIFYVTPKGVYSTQRLILDAASVYEGFRDRLPAQAIADTDQAGRCLAFSLPTAMGFHIARATEATIKRYMEVFSCDPVKESQRNWGKYISALRGKGASEKVLQCLEQIQRLHRNPLIHPEETLTLPEAAFLWAICTSAVMGMVADMETKAKEPNPEILDMLPESVPEKEPEDLET